MSSTIVTSAGLWLRRCLVLVLVFSGAGCDELLEVERSPGTIPAEGISGEGSFQARYIGAASLFTVGTGMGVVYGGLFTDELLWSGSFPQRDQIDRRSAEPGNDILADEPYTSLQRNAKVAKDLQREILDGLFPRFVPTPTTSPQLAQVSLYSGFARVYLADLFCTLAFDNTGPEMNSADVYRVAIDDFTKAIDATQATAAVRNAARVGRARARLMIGDKPGALADALLVPQGFSYVVEYSDASTSNTIWSFTWSNRRLPVSTHFRQPRIDNTQTIDPRVRVVDSGRTSFSGSDRAWAPQKYSTNNSPIRIASWEEAQFIIAEVQGSAAARTIINDLRARNGVTIVWDPTGTATAQQILAKVIDEKGRTLLLEGYRMGDLRRYAEQHQMDLFPTGERFGNQTCMPLPNKERLNNPGLG